MNTTERIRQAAELAAIIMEETQDDSRFASSAAIKMIHLANRLRRFYELDCNQGLTDKQQHAMERIEEKAEQLAKEIEIPIEFNSDPRGWSIKFKLRSGRYNDMGGETWGI